MIRQASLNDLLLFFFLLTASCIQAQTNPFVWVKGIGNSNDEVSIKSHVDISGNVVSVGRFKETLDMDPDVPVVEVTTSGSAFGMFISKHNEQGQFVWARSIAGSDGVYGGKPAIDASGNVYVTGWFYGSADFNTGAATQVLTTDQFTPDIFILKLDSDGEFMWVKQIGGEAADIGNAITIDGQGNILVSGSVSETVDFDPGVEDSISSGGHSRDAFILKLDDSGDFTWARRFDGDQDADGFCIDVDNAGNIYASGGFDGVMDLNPGEGLVAVTNTSGAADTYILKLDANGDFIWGNSFSFSSDYQTDGLHTDNSGDLIFTGNFINTVDFDPGTDVLNQTSLGSGDVFLLKLNELGHLIWVRTFGGLSADAGSSLVTDISGNIFLGGAFSGIVDFDPGAEVTNLNVPVNFYNGFITTFDSSGNFIRAMKIGGDENPRDFVKSVGIDGLNNIYVTGSFQGTVDFNETAAVDQLTSNGENDLFMLKLGPATTAIGEAGFSPENYNIFPNPANSPFCIIKHSESIAGSTIRLRNITGQLVKEWPVTAADIFIGELNEQESGIYLIEITEKNGHSNYLKLIRE